MLHSCNDIKYLTKQKQNIKYLIKTKSASFVLILTGGKNGKNKIKIKMVATLEREKAISQLLKLIFWTVVLSARFKTQHGRHGTGHGRLEGRRGLAVVVCQIFYCRQAQQGYDRYFYTTRIYSILNQTYNVLQKTSADFAFFKVSTLNRLPYADNLTEVPFGSVIGIRGKVKVC